MYPASVISELRLGKAKPFFSIKSAIDKSPAGHCQIESTGLVGDEQAESFHGGPERAVLQFDSGHYAQLQQRYPNSADLLTAGGFGENLVAAGMNEHNMCIGDVVSAGSAVLEVTQPRQPCFKLNHRFKQPDISRYVQDNAKTGWFYRVLQPGTVKTGDPITVTHRPFPQWSIARVQHYLYLETENREATKQLAQLAPLGDEVKSVFQRRLENDNVEDWTSRLSGKDPVLEMRIVKIERETDRVKRFFLSLTNLAELENFSAGAHITLQLPNGLARAYTLCAPLSDDTYQIAVNLADKSRGGSYYLHHEARVGDTLLVSGPANGFRMARDKRHIFIAAGIGITPFITMIKEARHHSEEFELHYCVDNPQAYAFMHHLAEYPGKVFVYDAQNPLDIEALLDNHTRGCHVYSCGSPAFTERVRESCSHWSEQHVHFEHFSAPKNHSEAFVVTIAQTGQKIEVSEDQTLLNALRDNGITVDSACETGVCGKCRVSYKGEADHRDSILTNSEKKSCMTPCVSRAKGKTLTISVP